MITVAIHRLLKNIMVDISVIFKRKDISNRNLVKAVYLVSGKRLFNVKFLLYFFNCSNLKRRIMPIFGEHIK